MKTVAMLLTLIGILSGGLITSSAAAQSSSTQPKVATRVVTLNVSGMTCAGCEAAVKIAAKRVDGVSGEGAPCGDGCTRYDNGAAPVMTWVHTGGHDYPPSTAAKIARFFRDHPRAR